MQDERRRNKRSGSFLAVAIHTGGKTSIIHYIYHIFRAAKMQNSETMAIVKKGNVFDINDVLHDFQANFLNEVVCREWILKRLQSD
jgi:hypothetical protein